MSYYDCPICGRTHSTLDPAVECTACNNRLHTSLDMFLQTHKGQTQEQVLESV